MNSANDIWNKVLELLKRDLTPTAIDTWLDDCRAVDFDGGQFIICSPIKVKRDILETRFSGNIKAALEELFSGEVSLLILSEEGEKEYLADLPLNTINGENLSFNFDTFVVGNSNKYAYAAAKAVAASPATKYNPLFIYGGSGLGKTHLLYSIANSIRKQYPNYSIVYAKGDDMINELVNAINKKTNVEFRNKYRKADLLLVDDIQFIAGKEMIQEEFFNTFNTLWEANKQIVLTSDRPPIEMVRLDDRLRTRFEWGLLADVQPPDYETRMAIIINKAKQLGLVLSQDVVEYIAENLTSNVRQLEGAVRKITAYRDLMDTEITKETVSMVIKDMFKDPGSQLPTSALIIDETSSYFKITPADVKGISRMQNIVLARQICMYLLRKHTNFSLEDIGKECGGKDHSTVISSLNKIEEKIKVDKQFSDTIRDIEANINSKL